MEKEQCDIILRTCSEVYAMHPHSTLTFDKDSSRMVGPGIKKVEITLRSLYSLILSMNGSDDDLRLIIIDDHSSEECLFKMKKLLEILKFPSQIISTNQRGNGKSLQKTYEWARDNGRETLFFVEDDYVHERSCVSEMLSDRKTFQRKLNREVALSPCDYPDNYSKPQFFNIASHIALGSKRHWRTAVNSTCTFLCSKKILKENWEYFEKMSHYGDDESISEETTLNKIWRGPYSNGSGAFLLSPIPSLSAHLQYATESEDQRSPFIDWRKWWDEADYSSLINKK